MREIIFDTETTGLEPGNGDRLVEIGCIEMVDRIVTGRTFHAYFNPGRTMPAEAERVHGLSDAFLANKPFFADQADKLLDFIEDSPLVAHNASFDFGFLNMELGRCGLGSIGLDRMVDTIAIARTLHPGAKHTLDALCSRYGIDRSHRVKHGALLDAELLAQLYIELTGGRQIGLSLVRDDMAGEPSGPTRVVASIYAKRPVRSPRLHSASPQELERHRAFIDQISNALWSQGASRPNF